jgi:hypothetical protein
MTIQKAINAAGKKPEVEKFTMETFFIEHMTYLSKLNLGPTPARTRT